MQMRPLRAAGAPAIGDKVPLLDREQARGNVQEYLPGLQLVLLPAYISGQRREEFIQMGIERGITVGMTDIERLPESLRLDLHMGNISVGRGIYRQVHSFLGPYVQSH